MRAAVVATLLLLAACGEAEVAQRTGGDPVRGRVLAESKGCGTCHTIPGIAGARGRVGPPLAGIANRSYLAGRLPNNPDTMTAWLQDPPAIDPQTAMPNLGLDEGAARDIAAYLATLR